MCLEKVSLQRLGMGFGADGPARHVESELRLSWEPSPDNPTPTEARTLRQVLRVNGIDAAQEGLQNCTTPEQQDSEEQPLSILLPSQRAEYTFTLPAAATTIDRRDAIVDRVPRNQQADRRCLARRGQRRLHQLRHRRRHARADLDRRRDARRAAARSIAHRPDRDPAAPESDASRRRHLLWTMERWDSSIRFKRVMFQDPEETLVLPVEVVDAAGHPRRRHPAPSHVHAIPVLPPVHDHRPRRPSVGV